jgi:hypothetical protein
MIIWEMAYVNLKLQYRHFPPSNAVRSLKKWNGCSQVLAHHAFALRFSLRVSCILSTQVKKNLALSSYINQSIPADGYLPYQPPTCPSSSLSLFALINYADVTPLQYSFWLYIVSVFFCIYRVLVAISPIFYPIWTFIFSIHLLRCRVIRYQLTPFPCNSTIL